MSMKYKLLLCVVVLLACTATLFAGTQQIYKQNFQDDSKVKYSDWSLQGQWAVISDVHAKPGIPVDPSPDGTAGLVYDKNADYGAGQSAFATTTAIDCSKYTGVQLSFLRSLTVEDAAFDQATVWVSKDGTTWGTPIYTNPTDSSAKTHNKNLTDPTWNTVSYDISAVADKQSKVFLRFGLATNQNNQNGGSTVVPNLHGWAIDDIVLTGADADAFYAPALSGTTLPAGFVTTPAGLTLWQIGPAVAGGGQTRDADGDPATPGTETVGADPGTNAAGVAGGTIIGTVLGGNYPAGMSAAGAGTLNVAPQYLAWGPLDLTGLQKTELRFQRWLGIGSGNLDKVAVQVHVSDTSLDNPDDPITIKDDKTANKINVSTAKIVYPVDTTSFYAQQNGTANNALKVTFKYNTNKLADANAEALRFQFTLDNSKSSPTWTTFTGGVVTTNTDDGVDSGVVTVTFDSAAFSASDYILAQNNKNFAVRAVLSKNDGSFSALDGGSTAEAIISEAKVVGVKWVTVFSNPTSSETLDKAWSLQKVDLSAQGADNNPAVWVRWSIGPTDSGFNTEYGGWNIDQPQVVEASREWKAGTITGPTNNALQWEKSSQITVPATNTGTATWDSKFSLYEVKGGPATVASKTEPGTTVKIRDFVSGPIARWSVDSIAVSGTVAPDAVYSFKPTIVAPPLTSVVYATPVVATSAADAALSALPSDWDMANETALGDQDWLPRYRGGSIATGGVVTTRFNDDGPGSSGNWARFWTEELAARSPMVVQGFGGGDYRPTVTITRAQIAVFIARAKKLDVRPATILTYGGPHFSDVSTDYWAYNEIEACLHAGIVSGFPDHTYQPELTILRDAMAKYITLGAGLTLIPAPTATDQAGQDAAVKNQGWFPDVRIWDDTTTTADERNPFRNFIWTLAKNNVVTGYANKDSSGNTYFTYLAPNGQAPITVDRASLAVYVWRGFMRDNASAVVIGGPGITDVAVATDGAAPGAVAAWYGYSNSGTAFTNGAFNTPDDPVKKFSARLAQAGDVNYAYVTFDALRFAGANLAALLGGNNALDVTFELRSVKGTTGVVASHVESIPAAMIGQWVTDVLAGTGEPYRNVAWQIPTGLQGDYNLVVTIEANAALSRQPGWSVMNGIYSDTFDTDVSLGLWTSSGQPVTPGPKIYPVDAVAAGDLKIADANTDLFDGGVGGSLEMRQTQAVTRLFPTTNRHNIRIGLKFAATGLGSNDSINAEFSKDYGTKLSSAAWAPLPKNAKYTFPLKGTAAPTKLDKSVQYFDLANGDPTADPIVIGADNNADFAIRLSINAATATPRAYFDTFTISGT